MAQLNITLNQDEILQLLSDNHDEALRKRYHSRGEVGLRACFDGS